MDEGLGERLFGNARVSDSGCWVWQKGKTSRGYGEIWIDGKVKLTHRVAWELCVAPLSEGQKVLHDCDNPPCINPAHLQAGTQADNMADMVAKGRQGKGPVFLGENNPSAKLTKFQVERIRLLFSTGEVSKTDIGRVFGISDTQVGNIVKRKHWK